MRTHTHTFEAHLQAFMRKKWVWRLLLSLNSLKISYNWVMDNGHYVNNVCAECNVHQQWKPKMKHAMWCGLSVSIYFT